MNEILDVFEGFFNRFMGLAVMCLTIYLFTVTNDITPGEVAIVIMLYLVYSKVTALKPKKEIPPPDLE